MALVMAINTDFFSRIMKCVEEPPQFLVQIAQIFIYVMSMRFTAVTEDSQR